MLSSQQIYVQKSVEFRDENALPRLCKQLTYKCFQNLFLTLAYFLLKKIIVRSVKLNPNIQTKSSTYCSYLRICILLLPANNEKVYVFSLSVNVRVAVPIFPLQFCKNNIFYWCYIIPLLFLPHTPPRKKKITTTACLEG